MSDESEVDKAKKLKDSKKGVNAFLRAQVEELDRSMAQHFSKGNYSLAAHDAKRMAVYLDLLSEIDVNS